MGSKLFFLVLDFSKNELLIRLFFLLSCERDLFIFTTYILNSDNLVLSRLLFFWPFSCYLLA